jgi:hypothetical protein
LNCWKGKSCPQSKFWSHVQAEWQPDCLPRLLFDAMWDKLCTEIFLKI